MSEKQKQIEKECRGVLELLLQKNGLKRKELVFQSVLLKQLTNEEKQ